MTAKVRLRTTGMKPRDVWTLGVGDRLTVNGLVELTVVAIEEEKEMSIKSELQRAKAELDALRVKATELANKVEQLERQNNESPIVLREVRLTHFNMRYGDYRGTRLGCAPTEYEVTFTTTSDEAALLARYMDDGRVAKITFE